MIRKNFPADDMMHEVHVLRACMPVHDGYAKIEDVLPATPVVASSRRQGWAEDSRHRIRRGPVARRGPDRGPENRTPSERRLDI